MYKKIEIWILYLVLVFVFISYIVFGALVRREIMKGSYIPIISEASKLALFFSEIPHNFKKILSDDIRYPHRAKEKRFGERSGFLGSPVSKEQFLLLSIVDPKRGGGIVELIDLKNFKKLHSWNPNIDQFWDNIENNDTLLNHLKIEMSDARMKLEHPILFEDGSILIKHQTPLLKIDLNSKLVFMKDDVIYHHSVEKDIDGNIWVCVRYYPPKIDKKVLNPNAYDSYLKKHSFMDDGIRKISSNGDVIFDKSISELFIENEMEYLLFSVGDKGSTKDPIHLNDIEPVNVDGKYWKRGDVFLSLRHQSMIILYRPSDNKIIWKKTGPFFHQHDVDILDNNRISIFNNNSKDFYSGGFVDGVNEVLIYDFRYDSFESLFSKKIEEEDVRTITAGRSQILDDGSLLIEESNYGRLIYFDSKGNKKWEYINRAQDGHLYWIGWSRVLYKEEDLAIVNNFLESMAK